MYLPTIIIALHGMSALASVLAHDLAARASCSTPDGNGSCMSTSSCGGFSVAGYCSGGSDNQCCVNKSCSNSQGSGVCKNTSKSCSGSYVSGLCPGDSSVKCCIPSGSGSGSNLPGLNAVQSKYARAIISRASSDGVGHHGCEAAIATALVESSIIMYANNAVPSSLNYPHDRVGSDHDSIGIFQQRASIYTNIGCDMGAACSAGQFITEMKKISGWQSMDVGKLCQKVQRSAYPDRYAAQVSNANSICSAGGL